MEGSLSLLTVIDIVFCESLKGSVAVHAYDEFLPSVHMGEVAEALCYCVELSVIDFAHSFQVAAFSVVGWSVSYCSFCCSESPHSAAVSSV